MALAHQNTQEQMEPNSLWLRSQHWKSKTGFQGHSTLHSEFRTNLSYMRLSQNKQKNKQTKRINKTAP